MSNLWVWSDPHINHANALKFRPQFSSMEEMNEAIYESFNSRVAPEDEVILLGDVIMGDSSVSAEAMNRFHGKKRLARGNHDTDAKIAAYLAAGAIMDVFYADTIKVGKQQFYLCHYPTRVENRTHNPVIVLHGHTHQSEVQGDMAQNLHMGFETFDAPIHIDDVLELVTKMSCT